MGGRLLFLVAMSGVPIGTFLAKMQYSHNEGKLPRIIHEDPTQPFHFAVLKNEIKEGEEFMIFHVSTCPGIREICGIFHSLFHEFKSIFGRDPKSLESAGVRSAFKSNGPWDAVLILLSAYRYPESFLYNSLCKLNLAVTTLFPRPSYDAAQFVMKSLIAFSKSMGSVEGIPSVLASYRLPQPQTAPILLQSESEMADVGPKRLIRDALEDSNIGEKISVFVFGRVIYTSMNDTELTISELLVANLNQTTQEMVAVDNRVFCLARHFHTVMVTITDPGRSLEKCCQMQVAMMKLDVPEKGYIAKMEQAFAKRLPPLKALDVFVVAGSFTLTNPPFVEAPLFAEKSLLLEANAVAAEMYEKMSEPAFKCTVNYIIGKTQFTVKCQRTQLGLTFLHTVEQVDERELSAVAHMLAAVRS
jgi:hypothetical protein